MVEFAMDPSAPLAVGVNTLLTSVATGTLAGAYGLLKGSSQVGLMITIAGLNGGVAGATFFSFREYVASPILLTALSDTHYSRRIRELREQRKEGTQPGEKLSWWDMRLNKVPDTAASGAFTGGVLNAWKRGRPGIVPGMVTAGLVCTMVQLLYNELGVARIKYVSRKLQASQAPTPASAPPQHPPDHDFEPPRSVSERIFSMLGWHKVSDDDYLAKLKLKREMYLRRIAELEQEKQEAEQQEGTRDRP
ncbi:uncharacterized protein C8Q71DRAFT_240181 [Rhodofomes roseus]|uniref:EcsC family protein n=1 Tax=Rhodofomes roseus TaxID=34475 RepID=A0ABQ8KWM4_9APHY|nr:uncharacterized protein C8Q71DRAFT_240181 [Rhodofomes roseus]KAH9843206.1 hypothetical protein C8Q71DRAFT_240181 [Rhodofomes roseus]